MDMKKLSFLSLICLFALLSVRLLAQEPVISSNIPVDPDSKKIMYKEVVQENGDPGYLYVKAIDWFKYYYVNPSSIFRVLDKVNGKIEGIGQMKIYSDDGEGDLRSAGWVVYTIRLEFKDDRYRYTLTDFNLKGASRFPLEKWLNKDDPAFNPQWDNYLYQIDTTMQRISTTLKEKMKPVVEKTDEW